ncbi:GNAT family N-acetyltransferase [Roseateles sp. MS654]|uniref:GNAT family N-acetyltransferase n=1 Tax=Roseateles sp. MS654 TaxID=3412685 RepID=UPI003C2B92D6
MTEAHFHLRDIAAVDTDAIDLIAQRMRATLVEVEGEREGTAMYSMDWLRDRVRWHLDPAAARARVVVAENNRGEVVGHTIFRVEADPADAELGLISTTYVAPEVRRHGVAGLLLSCAEAWFRDLGLGRSATWTSATNAPLIGLYERYGYAVAERAPNELTGTAMIRLERQLA